jgi:hypothetical protein
LIAFDSSLERDLSSSLSIDEMLRFENEHFTDSLSILEASREGWRKELFSWGTDGKFYIGVRPLLRLGPPEELEGGFCFGLLILPRILV